MIKLSADYSKNRFAYQAVEQAANTEFGSGKAEYNVENIEEIK